MIFLLTLERTSLFYLLLSALAGLGYAGWQILSKKVSGRYSLLQVMTIDNLIFTVISLLLTLGFKESIIWPSLSFLWLIVVLFAWLTLGASFLNIFGFRHFEVQKGSLLMVLEPVFGVIFGWLVFAEVLSYSSLIGGALIIFGAALPNLIQSET